MLTKTNPTTTTAWQSLKELRSSLKESSLIKLVTSDEKRFENYSIHFENILFDYSKHFWTKDVKEKMIELAHEMDLKAAIESMFLGEKINENEDRSVLHVALRAEKEDDVAPDNSSVDEAHDVLKRIESLCGEIHEKKWVGYTQKPITDIINIGIGGSDLGPKMVVKGLLPYQKDDIRVHFVSNVDGTHIHETLKLVDPSRTLFIIASKSFTTQETMCNAQTARKWFLENGGDISQIKRHFIAVSTNQKAVEEFGISSKNMFEIWDWVGGRFSLSSAIGIPIALSIGFDQFKLLLKGMRSMDIHFRDASFESNIPVIMGLLGVWYTNFFDCRTHAVLPYDEYLSLFPSFLQQGEMESNGKNVDRRGMKAEYATCPVVWGEAGTNGQHAFYQLLHQGSQIIPCDFIAATHSHNPVSNHHDILLSNFFAQPEALMKGKSAAEVRMELQKKGMDEKKISDLLPHMIFDGDRPSSSILVKKITPYTLGQLIAAYEHKIFVQGVIWNIFSFDQWGVELGKSLAKQILPELQTSKEPSTHDPSTNGLIGAYQRMKANKT